MLSRSSIAMVLLLAWAAPAFAQLGNTCGQTPDNPCFFNDFPISGLTSGDPITQSLTTTGGTNDYTPTSADIQALDHILFGGVTDQSFGKDELFPGWQACSPDCTTPFNLIINTANETYQGAMQNARRQESELAGEDLTDISTNSQSSTYVLPVLQDLVQAQLQTTRELQYIRNQLDTLIMVETTSAAIPLNAKAQDRANSISTGNPLLHGLLP